MSTPRVDVLIIGGGPAGSCAAIDLARRGYEVAILEKAQHPRFHVGESLLPNLHPLFDDLGLTETLDRVPKIIKRGAEIVHAEERGTGTLLNFDVGRPWGRTETFNAERAVLDKALLDHAAAQDNVQLHEEVSVDGIDRLADGDCCVQTSAGPMESRLVLDCSGQQTVLGRCLGVKQTLAHHRRVAFLGHFRGVDRLDGEASGHITLVMADDGWFWAIPIDEERTSIGLVVHTSVAGAMRRLGVRAGGELAWAIERTPCLARRTADAIFPESCRTAADFSYTCSPGAADGYLMVGDAEAFLDPVFSSGMYLAVASARDASHTADRILQGEAPDEARQRFLSRGADRRRFFSHYINLYYSHPFREMLLHGSGPLGVHRALIAVLSGRCEELPCGMRWRLRLLDYFHQRQRTKGTAVPGRAGWSILDSNPTSREQAIESLESITGGASA